jgi:hypothetical protein
MHGSAYYLTWSVKKYKAWVQKICKSYDVMASRIEKILWLYRLIAQTKLLARLISGSSTLIIENHIEKHQFKGKVPIKISCDKTII